MPVVASVLNKIFGLRQRPAKLDKQYFLDKLRQVKEIHGQHPDLGSAIMTKYLLITKDFKDRESETLEWLSEIILDKNEKDAKYKQTAINCLYYSSHPGKMDILAKCLEEEPNPSIRSTVISVAEKYDIENNKLVPFDNRAIPILVKCLNDNDQAVRWSAVHKLGMIGDLSTLEVLEACKDKPELTNIATSSIEKIKSRN